MLVREILYGLLFLSGIVLRSTVRSRAVRQIALLVGSYALYLSWSRWFAIVLLASTLMNFAIGNRLQKHRSAPILWIGIFLNVLLLSSFKYFPQVLVNFPSSSSLVQHFSHLALPLGISFWTFQAMSYLFDLYRGTELDPTFLEFALFMVLFPVVISGPICRLPAMLPQFRSQQTTTARNIERGLSRIAIGFLMMQLARLLGQGVLSGDGINSGFDNMSHWSGPDVWCLAFGYGLQLFFDFAGYSHIAIGAAQAMGFVIPENFARPFESTSPSIFWTRWHMSLSFWIRDYVFLFLIVLWRNSWWRNSVFIISMVLFGLWHKATLLFLLWGLYHGILLVMHRQIEAIERKFDWTPPAIWTPISWAVTITLVSLGWIFFRANSIVEARRMFSALTSIDSYSSYFLTGSLYILVTTLAIGYMAVVGVMDSLSRHGDAQNTNTGEGRSGLMAVLARSRIVWVPPLYVLALLLVFAATHTSNANAAQFMYRNF
jgi:alginate O-acetyltransferase complex protein AlgI